MLDMRGLLVTLWKRDKILTMRDGQCPGVPRKRSPAGSLFKISRLKRRKNVKTQVP
jgi:hypothetical protein